MVSRHKRNDLFCFSIAVSIIIMMNPYFVWTSFSHLLQICSNVFVIVVLTYELIHIIVTSKVESKQVVLVTLIMGYVIYRTINSHGLSLIYHLKVVFPVMQLIAFSMLTEEERLKTYAYFKKIFCVLLCMGLFTYPLAVFNVRFAGLGDVLLSESSAWSNGGYYYKNYFLAIYTANDSAFLGYIGRFCGVFNEPGVVGTFSALFLIADRFDLTKKDNLIFLISGLLAFSFAFYMMIGVYLLLFGLMTSELFRSRKKWMYFGAGIVCLIVVVVLWLCNSSFHNLLNELIISRLKRFMVGDDNRTTLVFDAVYSSFKTNGGFFHHLFGNGFGSVVFNEELTNTSSYKTQIYDLGYFGLIYLYTICIYANMVVNPLKNRKAKMALLCIFLMSTYQRIGILDVSYMSILMCGGNDNWTKNAIN